MDDRRVAADGNGVVGRVYGRDFVLSYFLVNGICIENETV